MTTTILKSMTTTPETSESTIKLGIAVTPEEKRQIYHFRYQTYIEEMSKNITGADHVNELLHDELDEWALLLYVKKNEEVIATARVNIGALTDFPAKLVDILSLNLFQRCYIQNDNPKFSYCAKLMVAPPHRSSPALYLLIAKCYELSVDHQVEFGYTACNFHLLRLYEQMGFHRYKENFYDSGYGLLSPIVLAVNDIQHLRTVHSPLFRAARKRKEVNTQVVEAFHEKITKDSPIVNSQIVTEEELWFIVCNFLQHPPTEVITILHGLSETEAKKFIHSCGSIVQCNTGDIITNQGEISYSYDILLTGKLKSLTFHHPIKEYTISGQHFGANGLTEHNKHTEDIKAVDAVEILVLSGMAFPRFFHSHPDIAHKIVRTLSNLR
ncbi:GNAT family N-acyltransferase [Pelosinus propionicus]|uniref:Acetyltransferase (GNAT) domain-containing protein n=1 Tax=Pelosinus propionicus DSM 13327 TaxID=1123291 RepID=A0A1I4H0X7_9FIRM|nr:GNAT family N-acyltransferase [Pelosinus propionicus]SFL35879.1 Acetyltransferase (GNAT) domain-containing protein [Pelosinus propionicus DSM 13327]